MSWQHQRMQHASNGGECEILNLLNFFKCMLRVNNIFKFYQLLRLQCSYTFNIMMSVPKDMEIGKIEEKQIECKEIEWTIPDFFSRINKARDGDILKSRTFSFNGDIWWLSLETNEYKCDIGFHLCLERKLKLNCPVKYNIGLKSSCKRELHLYNGILYEKECFECIILNHEDLLQRKSEFTSSDSLSIVCTLKLVTEIVHSSEADLLDEKKTTKFMDLDKLSDSFKDLFGNKETCDTTLKVKDKDFRAHRLVLITRSSVFAATFKHDSLECQTGIIKIPDCDPDSFQEFLEYLYCGKLEEISLGSALNLYYTSDKYDVQELKKFCIEYLMQCLTVENVCKIAVLADQYEDLQLYSVVREFFNEHTFKILLTTEWDDLLKKDYRLANKLLKETAKEKEKK